MGPIDSLNHLANMLAPAMFVALLVALLAGRLPFTGTLVRPFWVRFLVNFVAGAIATGGGAWVFDQDGKMLSYIALVLLVATAQWLLGRAWKA